MGSEENRDRLLQERSSNNNVINCSSSEDMVRNAMRSDSMFKSSNALDPYYNSSWDPSHMVSLNQCGNIPNPSMIHQARFGDSHMIGGDSSHLVPITSDLVDVLPNMANYSEMARYNSNFARKTLVNVHEPSMNTLDSHENCQNSDNVMIGSSSHYGKRKRKTSPKNTEKEQQKDLYVDSCEAMHKEGEQFRQNIDSDSHNKQQTKLVKDSNSNGEEPSKANYIHVRAKRGQATNSHSLAERVRRERISERMRLLQELVPGCNKITGKAVMLDEIINYVQSLQQQVEFLSMKLATVNPELNIDIDRLLTKDILHLQGNNTNAFGINPGSSSTPQHFLGYPQGTFNGATQTFNHLPQHIWNTELQGILQMGFDPQPSSSSLGPNGLSKIN